MPFPLHMSTFVNCENNNLRSVSLKNKYIWNRFYQSYKNCPSLRHILFSRTLFMLITSLVSHCLYDVFIDISSITSSISVWADKHSTRWNIPQPSLLLNVTLPNASNWHFCEALCIDFILTHITLPNVNLSLMANVIYPSHYAGTSKTQRLNWIN